MAPYSYYSCRIIYLNLVLVTIQAYILYEVPISGSRTAGSLLLPDSSRCPVQEDRNSWVEAIDYI